MEQADQKCLSEIAESVGTIHRNIFLLIDTGKKRTLLQIVTLQEMIDGLAAWEKKYLHDVQQAFEE
jgi:hypothetical protein